MKNMKSVESSNISKIGYDASTITLWVEFKDGSVYEYEDVPSSAYQDLMAAKSVGSHLAKHIKGTYRHKRLPFELEVLPTAIEISEAVEVAKLSTPAVALTVRRLAFQFDKSQGKAK